MLIGDRHHGIGHLGEIWGNDNDLECGVPNP